MHYEADAAARYVAEGRTESPLHDHERTVGVIGLGAMTLAQRGHWCGVSGLRLGSVGWGHG